MRLMVGDLESLVAYRAVRMLAYLLLHGTLRMLIVVPEEIRPVNVPILSPLVMILMVVCVHMLLLCGSIRALALSLSNIFSRYCSLVKRLARNAGLTESVNRPF